MDDDTRDDDSRRAPFRRPLLAAALAASALAPAAAQAQVEIFLRLDGIPGESIDAKHKDEIEVIAWSDAFSFASASEGRATGRIICSGITLTKEVDKASLKLLEMLMTNGTISQGTLSLRRSSAKTLQDFYIIDMANIKVVSHAQFLSSAPPQESVVLKPVSYKFRYLPQDLSGQLGPAVTASGSC